MAHSKSMLEGQFPKKCDLCESDIKIDWKCVTCNLFMCTKCKEKVHSKFKSADKHKIIDIKEVGQHSDELDFSNLNHVNCEDHEGQTCFMFCKPCKQLVCPQCIAEVHEGHGLVQISEGYKIQIENMKKIQKQIKSHIKELTNGGAKIKSLKTNESSQYTETRNLIQAQNAALKKEVDKYTEKLINELDQKWKTLQNSIDEEEGKVTAMKTSKEDQNTKIEDIINAKDADQVFKESKQMGKLMNEAVEPVKLDFCTMPKFIPGDITEYNFGSLKDITKDLKLNIHQQFTTDIDNVFHLSTCPDNSLWISDAKVIQKVKPEGSNLKVVSNFNMEIYGMALTPSNDLLLVNGPRLKQIRGSSGQITDSVYSVDPLHITTVHVTSDYKVIVGAKTGGPAWPATGRRVVIRMNKEGQHEKTYEHDRNKQTISAFVRCITTTTNGKIFVVDKLSEDSTGRVVVLGQDGNVLNTYTGHPMINSYDKPFKPVRVVTTPLDNIIVTTLNNDYLYILNSVGNLITYYNINNIGILCPFSLSFTTSGQLYIGCTSTDKAKLYKVDISQI